MTIKDRYLRILERHGRSFDDVLYVQQMSVRHRDCFRRRYTTEQFLRFSESYDWHGGEYYWSFAGRDFAITGYRCWYDTLEPFTWLVCREYRDSGSPHEGRR